MKSMILVACHKPCNMYNKGIYTPIQVGKAISEYDLGIIGDDTGDNISQKNPSYCELTAQYWAWKNVDCRYIGLCHYRRYFETVYTDELLERLFRLAFFPHTDHRPMMKSHRAFFIYRRILNEQYRNQQYPLPDCQKADRQDHLYRPCAFQPDRKRDNGGQNQAYAS